MVDVRGKFRFPLAWLPQIKNPRVSHTQLRGRLADVAVLRLAQVRWGGGQGRMLEKQASSARALCRTPSLQHVTQLQQQLLTKSSAVSHAWLAQQPSRPEAAASSQRCR
jgi:hypothetical protein